ncbi:MAG TPA: phosphoribosylamine--glycine ligase [Myxococcota bacterium]|nr:phosphoribosylamine--glycine ligase [Myxococcota bacterium]
MRVLVLGSGGREHALAWAIGKSPLVEEVLCAPGSDGIALDARVLPVDPREARAVLELVKREGVSFVVIGPEDPLVAGVADRLGEAGVAVFGPSAAAAQLEGSKRFAKEFMARHGIPTAAHASFSSAEAAEAWVRERGGPCVVKADGLAAGKGVSVCDDPDQALAAIREIMRERRFGDSGETVVIEERLVGPEASFYALCDGERFVALGHAQDYKRALDGDAGENTGGVGSLSPAAVLDPALEREIVARIVRPTVAGMRAEGRPFRGVLYVGLMLAKGRPYVIEYNVRFGDPETQALMLRLESDLVPLLVGAAEGRLAEESAAVRFGDPAVCVVMTSAGYPRAFATGREIRGLDAVAALPDAKVFHSGTRRRGPGRRGTGRRAIDSRGPETGPWETAGGRVLGVTARGRDLAAARARAYELVRAIEFEGAHARSDIGLRP